jgi:hypothetical protein
VAASAFTEVLATEVEPLTSPFTSPNAFDTVAGKELEFLLSVADAQVSSFDLKGIIVF